MQIFHEAAYLYLSRLHIKKLHSRTSNNLVLFVVSVKTSLYLNLILQADIICGQRPPELTQHKAAVRLFQDISYRSIKILLLRMTAHVHITFGLDFTKIYILNRKKIDYVICILYILLF